MYPVEVSLKHIPALFVRNDVVIHQSEQFIQVLPCVLPGQLLLLYLFLQGVQEFLMGDISHYHSRQLLALETQVRFKLFFLEFDNLLLLLFNLGLMGYALLFNHAVFLLLHGLVDDVLQQQ